MKYEIMLKKESLKHVTITLPEDISDNDAEHWIEENRYDLYNKIKEYYNKEVEMDCGESKINIISEIRFIDTSYSVEEIKKV